MSVSSDMGRTASRGYGLFAPRAPRPRRRVPAARAVTLAAIITIGLLVSALGTWAIYLTASEGERARAAELETAIVQAIRSEAEDAVGLAMGAATFLTAVPDVSADAFSRFAAAWRVPVGSSPAVRALAYVRKVRSSDLPAFENRVREAHAGGLRAGYPAFDLFPRWDRPVYFPAWLVEPVAARHGVYGYDLGSDPARLAAATEAAGTGMARMSQPIVLSQDMHHQETSSLILAPVYAPGATAPVSIDNPLLLGFAGVGFSPGRALVAALSGQALDEGDIGVSITDVGQTAAETAAETDAMLLFSTRPGPSAAGTVGTANLIEADLTVAGRTWRISIDPGSNGLLGEPGLLALMILAVGLAFTAALAALVNRVLDSQTLMATRVEEATHSLRLTAEDLRRSRDEAYAANSAKTEFLARMSHELRSPLTPILGFSEMIRDSVMGPIGSAIYRDYAESIHKSGSHLLAIVNDLLDLSKLEAGRQSLQEAIIDPVELVTDLVQLNASAVNAAGLALVNTTERGAEDLRLLADPRLVQQMVQNLISNSMKFTPTGGRVTISVGYSAEGCPTLSVHDTGIGMTADEVERARQPFAQIENVFHRQHEGAGLGISLVEGMMHLHEGQLDIESSPGAGTTARLVFPTSRVHSAEQ